MIDLLASLGPASLSLSVTALVLAGTHALAFRAGRRQVARSGPATEHETRPEAEDDAGEDTGWAAAAPPQSVLVVDNDQPARSALRALDAEFGAVPVYVETLLRQIEGVKTDAEAGIALVIHEVDAINGQARDQIGRMHASLDGSEALARSSARPREIIGNLQATLDERTAQIRTNFDSLSELAQEFQSLRPIIDTMAAIADQAYFLSINAAVEAARAGSAGAAFALVAGEVRALSKLTQNASKEIGAGIATFTRRMHEELDRARPQAEGSSCELDRLIGELNEIQGNLATAGQELSSMIQSMDGGHRQMVERLSTILGHVQFQDVIRQRLEQVGEAIGELGDHVCDSVASARLGKPPPAPSLDERLQAQQSRYVMHSQRAAHAQVTGDDVQTDLAPRIELF
ncbi:methyl-accepting chemotaxis protein [Novosphingobium sp.]|uniref:methyl-accepting chemotaxis protein n=1 Tax=Novosphingobium sp. TaxID=1874826 RepID=UPI0038B6FBC1